MFEGFKEHLVPQPEPPKRSPAHYLWTVLIARGLRPCGTDHNYAQIKKILDHIGVDSELPRIAPARGPPMWEDCDAQMGEGVEVEPDWDLAAQPAPAFDADQRVNW